MRPETRNPKPGTPTIPLALIRHGPTEWNAQHRVQGQIDTPLSDAGRHTVGGWSLPADLRDFDWVVSPLRRARETARLLGVSDTVTEPALMEMHWGEWEGHLLPDLRRRPGADPDADEARGLDFRPPGGESRRMLQRRISGWFAEVARRGRPVAAVTHHGVIQATLALALDWDMRGSPPLRLRRQCVQFFHLDPAGRPRVHRLNVPLVE